MFIDDQIYQLLTSDTTLMGLVSGVYNSVAPWDADFPYIVFYLADSDDSYTLSQRYRTVTRYEFFVCGTGVHIEAIQQAIERLDELLNDHSFDGVAYFRRNGARFPVSLVAGGELVIGFTVSYRMEVLA